MFTKLGIKSTKTNNCLPSATQILIKTKTEHYRFEFTTKDTKVFMKDSSKEVKICNANNGERINDGTWSGHHSLIDVDSDGVVRDMVSFQVC